MTRHWTVLLCLLLSLALVSTQVSAVMTGTPALADNGNGNGNDKKDKDKDNEKEEKDKGKGNDDVEPAAPYRVEVSCDIDGAAGQTACTFTGVAPEGAKSVGHLDMPAAEICGAVLGGDAEYVDPDPNTGVVGYKSKGDGGVFTLILEGNVTTGGTATYWIKSGDGVFPATGPGLNCAMDQQPAEVFPTPIVVTGTLETATTTEDAATGTVGVYTYACATDADSEATDWFGSCKPGVSGVRFALSPADGTTAEPVGDGMTQAGGEVRFDGLAPGAYDLDAPDATWCHAESDSVNEHGELVVTAGADVSVWIFLCGAGAPTRPATPAPAAG
jgi:hypothetical protein